MITLRFFPLHHCYTYTWHAIHFSHPSNGSTSYNFKTAFLYVNAVQTVATVSYLQCVAIAAYRNCIYIGTIMHTGEQ